MAKVQKVSTCVCYCENKIGQPKKNGFAILVEKKSANKIFFMNS